MSRKRNLSVWMVFIVVILAACGGAEEGILVPTPIQVQPTAVSPTDADDGADESAAEIPTPIPEPTTTNTNPTPVPSPTLAPTIAPTATAVSVTDPDLTAVNAANLPTLNEGVVFIAEGALKVWRQDGQGIQILLEGASNVERQNQHEKLVGDVTQFAVNLDGTRLVATRLLDATELTDPQTHMHELVWFDLISGESRQIALGLEGMISLGLSDDGKQVAYAAKRLSAPDSDLYSVYLLNAEDRSLPQSLGDCLAPCGNPVWHPDNSNVVWSDGNALWIFNVAGNAPRQLLENNLGGEPADTVVYSPIAWAKNGRYLLMWQAAYEGGQRAVLDVPTGQVLGLADSFVYVGPTFAEVSWMQDDRLLVMRPDAADPMLGSPTIELWRVQEAQGELVLEERSVLSELKGFPVAPKHLLNGRFAFALENSQDSSMSGLYILTSLGDQLTRSNGILPAMSIWDIESVWAPTGNGAIVGSSEGQTVYAAAGSDALYDITTAIGRFAHSFHWLPRRTN